MPAPTSSALPDGGTLSVEILNYPLDEPDQLRLIRLKQNEWDHTDIDWLASMNGAYADTLMTQVAIGAVKGQPVSTATVAYPVDKPEICIVQDVMTLQPFRGRGIAARLTDLVVQEGYGAGCRLAFLGNAPLPQGSVYERIGFVRIAGAMMRRAAPGCESYEETLFAPGQSTRIRETAWGDLPGLVCLMSKPVQGLVVDFPRGLVSIGSVRPVRAVSNFTSVRHDTLARSGSMLTLVGETTHRVLGFGSLTPGPAPLRNRTAVIDLAFHDAYGEEHRKMIARLVEEASQRSIHTIEAYVSPEDDHKAEWFIQAGFQPVATLPNQFYLEEQGVAATLMQRVI